MSRFNRVGQRVLVHDPTSRTVDDAAPIFHRRNPLGIYHATSFRGQGCVHGQIVTLLHDFIKVSIQHDTLFGGPFGGKKGIVSEHSHIESQRPVGDGLADPAQTDDGQGPWKPIVFQ